MSSVGTRAPIGCSTKAPTVSASCSAVSAPVACSISIAMVTSGPRGVRRESCVHRGSRGGHEIPLLTHGVSVLLHRKLITENQMRGCGLDRVNWDRAKLRMANGLLLAFPFVIGIEKLF